MYSSVSLETLLRSREGARGKTATALETFLRSATEPELQAALPDLFPAES
jgi:hypothetical protein